MVNYANSISKLTLNSGGSYKFTIYQDGKTISSVTCAGATVKSDEDNVYTITFPSVTKSYDILANTSDGLQFSCTIDINIIT